MLSNSERIEAAKAKAFSTRGPNKGHLKATCPPMGTDAAIFWQAAMMRCNPYKVSIASLMFLTLEQREFYAQCEAWVAAQHSAWAIGADKDRAQLTSLGVY
jgi:hypothetical protein